MDRREKQKLVGALDWAHRVVKLLVIFNFTTLLVTLIITLCSCRTKFNARLKISDVAS